MTVRERVVENLRDHFISLDAVCALGNATDLGL
jgi:hypothetical protein